MWLQCSRQIIINTCASTHQLTTRYLCTQHLVTIVAQSEKEMLFNKTTLQQGKLNKTSNLKYLISKSAARLSTKYSSMKICEIEKTALKVVGSSFLVVTEHWQPEQRPRPRVRQSWPSWSFLRLPSASTVFNLVSPSLSLIFFTITYVLITVRLFGLALTYF